MELEKENIVLYLRFAEKLVQSIPCKIFFSFYKEIEYLTFFSPNDWNHPKLNTEWRNYKNLSNVKFLFHKILFHNH